MGFYNEKNIDITPPICLPTKKHIIKTIINNMIDVPICATVFF